MTLFCIIYLFSGVGFLRNLFLKRVRCIIAFANLLFMNGLNFHVCISSFGVHGYQALSDIFEKNISGLRML